MSMNERLQNILAQLKAMEAYSNELEAREATIIQLLNEGRLASEALRSLEKGASDTFMPIGMGIYTKASIDPEAKFLVNVGAGISIEKSREEALTFVENRLRELEAALRNISAQKQEIQARMEQMRQEANSIIASMQK